MRATDRLLRIGEAADYLGIATGTLYHWVSEERIPVVRISPRAIRFRLSDLSDWAERMTVMPPVDSNHSRRRL